MVRSTILRFKNVDNELIFLSKVKVMGADGQRGLEVKVTEVKEVHQYEHRKVLFQWGIFVHLDFVLLIWFLTLIRCGLIIRKNVPNRGDH